MIMDCLVLAISLFRRRSVASRQGYRPLKDDGFGDLERGQRRLVTVVVGKEKREFLVDSFVLEESQFRVLMKKEYINHEQQVIDDDDDARKSSRKHSRRRRERRKVIFVDVDAILFEHMLWLMNNDSSSLFQLNLEEIVDFYAQDS